MDSLKCDRPILLVEERNLTHPQPLPRGESTNNEVTKMSTIKITDSYIVLSTRFSPNISPPGRGRGGSNLPKRGVNPTPPRRGVEKNKPLTP